MSGGSSTKGQSNGSYESNSNNGGNGTNANMSAGGNSGGANSNNYTTNSEGSNSYDHPKGADNNSATNANYGTNHGANDGNYRNDSGNANTHNYVSGGGTNENNGNAHGSGYANSGGNGHMNGNANGTQSDFYASNGGAKGANGSSLSGGANNYAHGGSGGYGNGSPYGANPNYGGSNGSSNTAYGSNGNSGTHNDNGYASNGAGGGYTNAGSYGANGNNYAGNNASNGYAKGEGNQVNGNTGSGHGNSGGIQGGSYAYAGGVTGNNISGGANRYTSYGGASANNGNVYGANGTGRYAYSSNGNRNANGNAEVNNSYTCRISTEDNGRPSVWAHFLGAGGTTAHSSGSSSVDEYQSFRSNGPTYSYNLYGFQAGSSLLERVYGDGSHDSIGWYTGYARANSIVNDVYGGFAGRVWMDSYVLGIHWDHCSSSGWDFKAALQGSRYTNVNSESVEGQNFRTNGWGDTATVEIDRAFRLGRSGWAIEPQAQAIYQRLSFASGQDAYAQISYRDSTAGYGRMGARLIKPFSNNGTPLYFWFNANVWSCFGCNAKTIFASTTGLEPLTLRSSIGGTWFQFGPGVAMSATRRASLFATLEYVDGIEGNTGHGLQGDIGFRLTW
ncbi:autotransporter domain-containing protein [Dyella monticola]|uniref:Autotransporter domain-containing protein n=1 Tax=Dyella monticola TaxID=1927958 RepID=A0A370WSK1_9GAMM|nr:autotransporter domain-containing protein [Dyella monticola]RDS79102.1 autotransporter domain-containing protein [Dyella monticola]